MLNDKQMGGMIFSMRHLWKITPVLFVSLVLGLIFLPQYSTQSQFARTNAHGTLSVSLSQTDENLPPVKQVSTLLEDPTIYLPLVIKTTGGTPPPPEGSIYGTVTVGGEPRAGILLGMVHDLGSPPYPITVTTTTASDGSYSFSGLPSLDASESYYVVYQNTTEGDYSNPDLLWYYVTPSLAVYTAGTDAFLSDFDLADIVLKTPPDFSTNVSIPVEFTWEKRTATPNDRYQWALYDKNNYPILTSPEPTDIDSYTLEELPGGITPSPVDYYQWEVRVYTEDEGYGLSYEVFWLTFAG